MRHSFKFLVDQIVSIVSTKLIVAVLGLLPKLNSVVSPNLVSFHPLILMDMHTVYKN